MFKLKYLYKLYILSSLLYTMINKVSYRKCRDCDIMLSYIPRMVRCFDCHKKYLDNAMISNKNDSNDKKKIVL